MGLLPSPAWDGGNMVVGKEQTQPSQQRHWGQCP